MDIETALNILKDKNPDYRKVHENIIKTFNFPCTGLLKDYLNMIKHDPLEWFNMFPKEYASTEALAKPKTALLHWLEKNERVRTELGASFCDDLAQTIHNVWKSNKDSLVAERKRLKELERQQRTPAQSEAGDNAVVNIEVRELLMKVAKLEQTNEVLMADNKALIEKLEDLKDIFIDTMKEKGVSEADVFLYRRLLKAW